MSGVGRLGTNPDAFGVWRADGDGITPWHEFLDAVAAAGYVAVELGPPGYLPGDPDVLRRELATRGLELTCGYLAMAFDDPGATESMIDLLDRTAQQCAGAPYVLALARAGWGDRGRVVPDDEHWRAIVDGLVALSAAAASRHQMQLVFHPHVGMAIETEDEVERLIDQTEGSVALCLDVGQFAFTGGDPASFLRRHGDVVAYLHLRDVDPVVRDACLREGLDFEASARRDVFCEPGDGCVDFGEVVAAAREVGFDGPVIVERSYLGRTPAEAKAAARRAATTYRVFGFG